MATVLSARVARLQGSCQAARVVFITRAIAAKLCYNPWIMIIFVMGTDTGVGKTFVTALLARSFLQVGKKVLVQKWVSTGNAAFPEDLFFIREVSGLEQEMEPGSHACPYCLAFPSSPHLAARMQGLTIEKERLAEGTRELALLSDVLLVEGVGGGLVPLTGDLLLMDLVAGLDLPVMLVSRTSLGTLNHTLLTLEALRRRGITTLGVVFNQVAEEDPRIVEDNMQTVAAMGRVKVYGPVPRVKEPLDALRVLEQVAGDILEGAP